MTTSLVANSLLGDWETPFGLPPFPLIEAVHFKSAFGQAMAKHGAQIDTIVDNPDPPNFENTIDQLELAGRLLSQVSAVFFNLCGAHTNPELQVIEREIAPRLARHHNAILLNLKLFSRVDILMADREMLSLTGEQARVLERYHTMFVRAGARQKEDDRARVSEIGERLAVLGTRFAQNVLADEVAYEMILESEDDLAGLPKFLRAAAAVTASNLGYDGKYAITLSRSSIEPFLQFSERRDLREEAFRAWVSRGEHDDDNDNREIVAETIVLRHQRAKILGFKNYAEFKLDDQMARTPDAVQDLLLEVWKPARAAASAEAEKLREQIASEGGNFDIAPWDWRHYAEKVRQAEYDFGETAIKPYFQLDRIIEAAFYTANRLFGLEFTEVEGLDLYHPDVRAFEVTDAAGTHVGLFLGDYFARASKRSGAWMSRFRGQQKLAGEIRPIIVNVMNFTKGPTDEPTLLTLDDAQTLFHEFGHALHGLMSDVTYPLIAGTNVTRDFVELPSQLFEHWIEEPTVLSKFAVHYQTGEPIPGGLLNRLKAAKNFNQGFATVEYLAAAIVDLELHMLADPTDADITAMENEILARIDMPDEITMRHRVPHFTHVFAGEGYAAGYYSYMWAEVMDADAFRAFEEAGDIFDPATAKRLAEMVYQAGGRQHAVEAYKAFRGRMPTIEALLDKRGLSAPN